ncbi:MAG: DUF2284 domain-containing protein [bacterium]
MSSKPRNDMLDNPVPKMGPPPREQIPRMPLSRIPCTHAELQAHLQKYVNTLLQQGAHEARIVSAREIPQDPRVMLKCHSPKCPFYGNSGSCPPHFTGTYAQALENLAAYAWAIVYRLNVPEEGWPYISGPGLVEAIGTKEGLQRYGSMLRYLFRVGDAAESAAYYDGHYFAINLHFGPCLIALCQDFGTCQEIKAGVCRFPLRAKPSVEQTFAIDLMKLAARMGWENYAWGYCAFPQDFPKDYKPFGLGIVLID